MECLLAMAIMALVFAAAAPLLQKAGACYSEADPRLSIIHEGRIGLATFTRAFRQARMLAQPASTSRTDSSMYFSTDAGAQAFYGLVTSKTPYTVQYGLAGAVGDLAFNCQSLWLTCYSADGTVLGLPGADPTAVRMVDASITVTDPNGRAAPVTFATHPYPAQPADRRHQRNYV